MANGNNGTSGHEQELVDVQGLKATLEKGGNKGLYNEATCSTAGGTAAKVTNTTPSSFSLVAGAKIVVKFTYAITVANATLQVGESTAKPIYYKGAALGANLVQAGSSILLHYDGTSFNIVGDLNTDTTYSVMGASGSTHASGLVPDTPTTAGTTKFLREDGTWQEPAGSNYSAGSGIDITNNEISVDSTVALKTDLANEKQGNGIGTCSTSSGTALTVSLTNYELVQNGFVAVTFENDVPANATLNINSKGAKAIYYKGAAIDGDTIKADDTALFSYDGTNYVLISSGGSGSIPQEELTISLASNQTADTGLNGATITVTQTGVVEPLYSGTWAGTNIVMNIDAGIEYTVTVGSVTGYATPATQTYSSLGNNSRTATFTYNTEVVTVTCCGNDGTSAVGQKVTVNGTQYTLDSTGIVTTKIPFGASYSVSADSWSGFNTPDTKNYTASQASRTVRVVWRAQVLGVYIEATDGMIYTRQNWPSAKTPNSIVIGTQNCSFRVSLIARALKPIHSNWTDPIDNYMTIPAYGYTDEKTYYNGKEDTEKLIQFNTAYGTNNTDYAAPYCASYTFPDGETKGYLCSSGEAWTVGQNWTEYSACMEMFFSSGLYFLSATTGTSTIRKYSTTNYQVYLNTSGAGINLDPGPYFIVPFGKY